VTTAASAVPVKQPGGRLKRRARQLDYETEKQSRAGRPAPHARRVLSGNLRLVVGRIRRHLATVNLFALAAVAAVAVVVPGLLTATIGHPAGIAGYLKLA
jgi:hypothetical protein